MGVGLPRGFETRLRGFETRLPRGFETRLRDFETRLRRGFEMRLPRGFETRLRRGFETRLRHDPSLRFLGQVRRRDMRVLNTCRIQKVMQIRAVGERLGQGEGVPADRLVVHLRGF